MKPDPAEWYALKYLGRSGGLHLADLERLFAKGLLDRSDLVRKRGWDRWLPAAEVAELGASFKQASLALDNVAEVKRSTLKVRLYHELISYAGIAAYLWVILLLLRLYESVVLQQYGLSPEGEHSLIVQALIIGKIILLVEMLRIGNRVELNTSAANIFVRSVFFALCLLLFNVLEHSAIALWTGKSVADALAEENTLAKIASVVAIMTIAFLPYHFLKEMQKTSREFRLFNYLFAKRRPS
jgi:hypothetical protein